MTDQKWIAFYDMGDCQLIVYLKLAVLTLLYQEQLIATILQFYQAIWQIADLNMLAIGKIAHSDFILCSTKGGVALIIEAFQQIPILKVQIAGNDIKR